MYEQLLGETLKPFLTRFCLTFCTAMVLSGGPGSFVISHQDAQRIGIGELIEALTTLNESLTQ